MPAVKIAIIGSNVPEGPFNRVFGKFGFERFYLNHCVDKMRETGDPGKSYLEMAAYYLGRNRCPRTGDEAYRRRMIEVIREEGISAVVVNTLKFCDFYPFDGIYLKKALGSDFPILEIEHDLMSKDEGQIMTRLEAFFESIKKKGQGTKGRVQGRKGEFFVGIDSGSHATKLVLINSGLEIMADEVIPTGTSVKESARRGYSKLLRTCGLSAERIAGVISTGYGRNSIDFATEPVTEITCHALGANHILKGGGTLIDIGGQDSKAIKMDSTGSVRKFAMNDKCAAGTGRFLEVIADRLQMSLEEFARLALSAKSEVAVSSMCSVFAESEVISLIASGASKEEISKGIHRSIASRTASLVKRVEGEPPYYMSGGVAKNAAMVKALSESLGARVTVIRNPQTVGALGAAIFAARMNG